MDGSKCVGKCMVCGVPTETTYEKGIPLCWSCWCQHDYESLVPFQKEWETKSMITIQEVEYRHALVRHAMCVEETARARARVRMARAAWEAGRRWGDRVGGASRRRLARDFYRAVRAYQRAVRSQAHACDHVIEEACL